jgi:ketosteroid isomerase-like protein
VDGSQNSISGWGEARPDGTPIVPIADRLADAINRHDLEALVGCFAPEVNSVQPIHPDRAFTGRQQIRENWGLILEGVPDLTARITGTVVAGDEAWVECDWAGSRRDGTPFHLRGVTIQVVRNDRIASVRLYMEPVEQAGFGVVEAVREAVGS